MKFVPSFAILSIAFILCLPSKCFADDITRGRVEITEEDASPSVFPYQIKFPNTSVTDNLDGTASISTATGDITSIGSCTTGDCFVAGDSDTLLGNRVGIGATSASAYLNVQSSTGSTFILKVADSGPNDRLVIQQDGSVGIGLTNPAQQLDITGDLRIGGDDLFMATNTDRFTLIGDGTNYNPEPMDLGADTTGNYVKDVADGTGIDGTATGETSTYTPTLDLTEINSATLGSGTFTTLTFDAGATDPVLTMGSNVFSVSTGNVGIGNTAPATGYKFEVTGDSKFSGDVNITGNLTAVTDQTVSGNIIMNDQKFIGLGTAPAGRLLFSNQATDVLGFLDSDVGIGTTNPTTKLDVSGTANATTLTEGGNAVYNSTEVPGGELGGTWASPTVDATHSGSAHHSAVTVSGVPDYITLTGQDIVRAKLDISDDTNATGGVGVDITTNDFTFDATELSALTWSAAGSAQYSWTYDLSGTDPKINFNNNSVNIETGNFGIGITAPLGRLQVGTTPGVPLFIVQDGGNVGIGTSNPGAKLEIIGTMRTSETEPFMALSINATHSGMDGIGKRATENERVQTIITSLNTGGSEVQWGLYVGVNKTTPSVTLQTGTQASGTITVTSKGAVGDTVPSGQYLYINTLSTGTESTASMFDLQVDTTDY